MARRSLGTILQIGIVVLAVADVASAWGPLTHVELANNLLAHLGLLPTAIGVLLARHSRSFIFGNIAADVVFAKKLSKVKQVCHRWTTGFSLMNSAGTDEGRAFGYGYLCHLAADTVAHNEFLPAQMIRCGTTSAFGHLYWEVRADSALGDANWQELRHVLRHRYPEPERLLQRELTSTLLPFNFNRRIFKRMNLLTCAKSWRRSISFWSGMSRWHLDPLELREYHDESLARAVDIIRHAGESKVTHIDPNGNTALGHARREGRAKRRDGGATVTALPMPTGDITPLLRSPPPVRMRSLILH
ncbi:MAG: zinc dependent phospholipase C family protein [Phycisphaerae bacterium]|nr:zinc dependent phospholipase C family protein [Phycisphaerae bacterium]